MKKIVLIGAGSQNFGLGVIGDIFKSSILSGSKIFLHDINSDTLSLTQKIAENYKTKFVSEIITRNSLGKENISLLKDAVIHIVRNALDHGIESPRERESVGKNEVGEITVSCKEIQFEEGPSNFKKEQIEVLIKDDGRGINSEKVCEKAIKMGLLKNEDLQQMSEEEKVAIIFNPGLTTKEKVSEISGRGIGMDVVKTNLQKMNADIKIKNKKGLGTEFHICIKK